IKVQKIAASCAGCALQADSALLNGIIWSSVNCNPVRSAIISCGNVEVPDVRAVERSATRVATAAGGNARTGSEKTKSRPIVVSGDNHREYGVFDRERHTHIHGGRPGTSSIA